MANLGSDDTAVNGESFNLPAGTSIDEDNGDLVIKDSNGTIVLRRDETSSEWQFESSDLSGIEDVDASSATLDDATVANSPTNSTDVVRKSETDAIDNELADKVEQTDFDDHSTRHEDGGADEINVGGLSGNLADQQEPTDHTHDGTADSGGASLNPNATTLQDTQEPTTDGEFRRSGSDVFIHTNGLSRNVSDFLTSSQVDKLWAEDGNSPKTVTSNNSITFTPATVKDVYKVFVTCESSNDLSAELTINNTSQFYTYRRANGNTVSSVSEFALGDFTPFGDKPITFNFDLTGRWGQGCLVGQPSPAATTFLQGGRAGDASSPLNQFTISTSNNWNTLTLEVYGRDI